MKTDKPKLPEGYTPFDRLTLCSNYLINVQVPFVFKNKIPLLIGKGDVPLIWLSSPIDKDAKEWMDIVIKNKKIHKSVEIGTTDVSWDNIPVKEKKLLHVIMDNKMIIHVIKHKDDAAEVTYLDLRPIGFYIFGDSNKLIIGNKKFIHNNFKHVWSMVGIG